MFAALGRAMFGDNEYRAARRAAGEEPVNTPQPATSMAGTFAYPFRTVDIQRHPGPAYHAPLLQFQEYPENVWEGWGGVGVVRFFRPYTPLEVTTTLQPVISGGAGTIHGQFFGYPLIDTNPSAVG